MAGWAHSARDADGRPVTTCAWDGKTLAADTRANSGGMPYQTLKVYKLSDGRLYAGCGAAEDLQAVRIWLESGGDKPTPKDFVGLVIGPNRQWSRYEDKLVPIPVQNSFHAVGSGRDYAIAAMHLGKTAREAVELACLYDIYTGSPITEVSLDDPSRPE
jgi:hypothetical protein